MTRRRFWALCGFALVAALGALVVPMVGDWVLVGQRSFTGAVGALGAVMIYGLVTVR